MSEPAKMSSILRHAVAFFYVLAAGLIIPSGVVAQTSSWTMDDLLKFSPEVYIHDSDRYLPAAVDPYYLDLVEVVERSTGTVQPGPVTSLDLAGYVSEAQNDYFLRTPLDGYTTVPFGGPIPPDFLAEMYRGQPVGISAFGERIEAPMYVHVLPGPAAPGTEPEYFDIQYIFFYPYSGPQVFRIGLSDSSNLCTTTSKWTGYFPPLATHEGDFEHVTVRVDATFTNVVAVYMDAHGSTMGRWWAADDPNLVFVDGTHVTVFSALSTHASYPYANDGITIESAPYEGIAAANLAAVGHGYVICDAIRWMNFADATRAGPRWQPWADTPLAEPLIELKFDPATGPDNDQGWVGFPGRFGAEWDVDMFVLGFPRLACNDFAPCSNLKNFAGEGLYDAFQLAEFLGKIDAKMKHRNGPSLLTSGWFLNGDPTYLDIDSVAYTVPPLWAAAPFNRMADLNGDGTKEIVSGTGLTWYVKWWDSATEQFTHVVHNVTGPDAQAANGGEYTWAGDYDGDGRDDIVVAWFDNIFVKKFVGESLTGNFESLARYTLANAAYNEGYYNWMGDLDGDGKDEIISASFETVWVKSYDPNTDSWTQDTYTVPVTEFEYIDTGVSEPIKVPVYHWGPAGYNYVADLEGDGIDEIISIKAGWVYVRRFNGTDIIEDPPIPWNVTGCCGSVLPWVGDINGDGLLDIMSANGSRFFVLSYDATMNRFLAASMPATGWGSSWNNWAADLNNDGIDEVLSANDTNVFVKGIIPKPSGTETYPTYMKTGLVSLPDINGNGIPEIVVDIPGSTHVHIRDGSTDALLSDIDFGSDLAFDMAVLPDLDGSGDAEVAMLQQQPSGQVRVQARDSVTGSVTSNLWYGLQYEPVSMDIVTDYSGNGFPEVAVLGSEAGTDAVRVQIRDSDTNTFLDNVFLGTQSIASDLVSVTDTSGNGIPEMGILGVLKGSNQVRAQMWDADTSAFQSNVWFGNKYQPQSMITMPDINSNGSDEIVAMGVDPATQNIRVQVRDSDTTDTLFNIWLGNVNEAVDIKLINDINSDGFPDLAVLLKTPAGVGRVRVQSGLNGNFIRNLFYSVVENPVGLAVMPDYSGNGFDELAALGESAGVRHVQILDTSSGSQVNRMDFP